MAVSLTSSYFDDRVMKSVFMDFEEREKVLKAQREKKAKRRNKEKKDGENIPEEILKNDEINEQNANVEKEGGDSSEKCEPRIEWAVGDFCRAIYSGDVLFYEGRIWEVIDDDTFKVEFFGYEDYYEVVKREYMMMSNGKAARQQQQRQSLCQWNPGDFCRALYEDGTWHEATLIEFLDDDEYLVQFIGYEGTEHVFELQPTRGSRARELQEEIMMARKEMLSFNEEDSECTDDCLYETVSEYESETVPKIQECTGHSMKSSARSPPRAKSNFSVTSASNKSGSRRCNSTSGSLNDRGVQGPSAAIIPPFICSGGNDDRAFNTLLVSWYVAGYYAGTRQGRRSRSRDTCCATCH